MNDKDILANAPDGATHYAEGMHYLALNTNKQWMRYDPNGIGGDCWFEADNYNLSYMRYFPLADIRALVEKDGRITELEKEREVFALEQQANGIDDATNKAKEKFFGKFTGEYADDIVNSICESFSLHAEQVRKQAAALKEQSK